MNVPDICTPQNPLVTLSFVVCSRNDQYGGNSLWRLETTLNFLAMSADNAAWLDTVEVLVCDWGSVEPLRESVSLTPKAAKITKFIEVSPSIAEQAQGDSAFAEVLANNVAIVRASGKFIGRIDQDTLVGEQFFIKFKQLIANKAKPSPQSTIMLVGRKSIPFSFASRSPSFQEVRTLVDTQGDWLPQEGIAQNPWFDAPVGIIMMHRDIWYACRGYDQRLKYWGFMETDLILRLLPHYDLINLEPILGRDFYHLSHARRSLRVSYRLKNERLQPTEFAPNNPDWGLQHCSFKSKSSVASVISEAGKKQQVNTLRVALCAEWAWQLFRGMLRLIRRAFIGSGISPGRRE